VQLYSQTVPSNIREWCPKFGGCATHTTLKVFARDYCVRNPQSSAYLWQWQSNSQHDDPDPNRIVPKWLSVLPCSRHCIDQENFIETYLVWDRGDLDKTTLTNLCFLSQHVLCVTIQQKVAILRRCTSVPRSLCRTPQHWMFLPGMCLIATFVLTAALAEGCVLVPF